MELGRRFGEWPELGRRFVAELDLLSEAPGDMPSEALDDLASLGPAPKPNQFAARLVLLACCVGDWLGFGGALGWSSGMGIFDRWMIIVCGGLYSFFLEPIGEK